jgi:hypothetical protein
LLKEREESRIGQTEKKSCDEASSVSTECFKDDYKAIARWSKKTVGL